jgi:hypothetical protein
LPINPSKDTRPDTARAPPTRGHFANQLTFPSCHYAIMISTLQAGLQLVLGLAADTAFVLASKPPHTAKPSEIEKDNQPIIDRSISSVHLFSSIFVYGLAISQAASEWSRSGSLLGVHAWSGTEWAGVGAMIFGGSLRLWCYRTLGQFFTFNVSFSRPGGVFDLTMYS